MAKLCSSYSFTSNSGQSGNHTYLIFLNSLLIKLSDQEQGDDDFKKAVRALEDVCSQFLESCAMDKSRHKASMLGLVIIIIAIDEVHGRFELINNFYVDHHLYF